MLPPLLIVFFMGLSAIAQNEIISDTIAEIQKNHIDGRESVKLQNYEEAMISLTKAYRLAAISQNNEEKLKVRFSLAQLNYYLQNYEKAAQETRILLENLKGAKNNQQIAEANTLLGLIYTQLGKLDEAEITLRKADNWFTSQNDETYRASVLLGNGILELKRDNYKTAIN